MFTCLARSVFPKQREHFITGVFEGFFCPKVFLPFLGNIWKSGKKTLDRGFIATFPKVSKKGQKNLWAEKTPEKLL